MIAYKQGNYAIHEEYMAKPECVPINFLSYF